MQISNHTAQLLGSMLQLPVMTQAGQHLTYSDTYTGVFIISHRAITLYAPPNQSAEIVSNGLIRIWASKRDNGLPLYVSLMQILGE